MRSCVALVLIQSRGVPRVGCKHKPQTRPSSHLESFLVLTNTSEKPLGSTASSWSFPDDGRQVPRFVPAAQVSPCIRLLRSTGTNDIARRGHSGRFWSPALGSKTDGHGFFTVRTAREEVRAFRRHQIIFLKSAISPRWFRVIDYLFAYHTERSAGFLGVP